jgi:ribosomal protein S10
VKETFVMDETEKLVAAIFAAAKCSVSGSSEPNEYLDQYYTFIRLMEERRKAAKKGPMPIPDKVLKRGAGTLHD